MSYRAIYRLFRKKYKFIIDIWLLYCFYYSFFQSQILGPGFFDPRQGWRNEESAHLPVQQGKPCSATKSCNIRVKQAGGYVVCAKNQAMKNWNKR
jgi:hypothetical protein